MAGGAEAVWYENPKGVSGYWAEPVVYGTVDDESATFADVEADGQRELVTLSNDACAVGVALTLLARELKPSRSRPRIALKLGAVGA